MTWKNDRHRHSLASRGIFSNTSNKIVNKIQSKAFTFKELPDNIKTIALANYKAYMTRYLNYAEKQHGVPFDANRLTNGNLVTNMRKNNIKFTKKGRVF